MRRKLKQKQKMPVFIQKRTKVRLTNHKAFKTANISKIVGQIKCVGNLQQSQQSQTSAGPQKSAKNADLLNEVETLNRRNRLLSSDDGRRWQTKPHNNTIDIRSKSTN